MRCSSFLQETVLVDVQIQVFKGQLMLESEHQASPVQFGKAMRIWYTTANLHAKFPSKIQKPARRQVIKTIWKLFKRAIGLDI